MAGILLGVVLFGSAARGDHDILSDLDILAIVKNKTGRIPDDEVVSHIPSQFNSIYPTISWYGIDRYRRMHADGELFAWHVFQDGLVLFDSDGVLSTLGRPNAYHRALEDIDAFLSVASHLPKQIAGAEFNAVYEMGILYVCLRNVAMSASWLLAERPDFTRLSPYALAEKPCLC